jgi:rhodanese-related sulfurtransferase
MKIQTGLLFFALLFPFGAFAGSDTAAVPTCGDEEHYPLISRQELADASTAGTAFIVDVNSDESFKKVHVPGAIHFGSHEKDFATLLPKDKGAMIVAYCGGPQCTAWKKAAKQACEQGYTNIRHFKGGISGWVKGLKTASN